MTVPELHSCLSVMSGLETSSASSLVSLPITTFHRNYCCSQKFRGENTVFFRNPGFQEFVPKFYFLYVPAWSPVCTAAAEKD